MPLEIYVIISDIITAIIIIILVIIILTAQNQSADFLTNLSAMDAEFSSSGVSQPAEEERRLALNGLAYTWPQFLAYYEKSAASCWNSADIHRAGEGSAGNTVVQAAVGPESAAAAAVEATWRVCRVCGVYEPVSYTHLTLPTKRIV